MAWKVIRTDRFSEEFRKFEKNKQFVEALDKKIRKFEEDPNIGSYLAGRLHGYKSIRLLKNFRILFQIEESESKVYLVAIDHRKHDYENF